MHVRVEVDQIPEGLDKEDETRAGARNGSAVRLVNARAMMRQSPPRSDRRYAKNGRMSFGTVKTCCRCSPSRFT
jgi:hypothetical protein